MWPPKTGRSRSARLSRLKGSQQCRLIVYNVLQGLHYVPLRACWAEYFPDGTVLPGLYGLRSTQRRRLRVPSRPRRLASASCGPPELARDEAPADGEPLGAVTSLLLGDAELEGLEPVARHDLRELVRLKVVGARAVLPLGIG